MEIRELHLDRDTTTTVHGDLYGLDYSAEDEGFQVKYFLDLYNERIRVIDYEAVDNQGLVRYLDLLCKKNEFSKVFLKAKADEWEKLLPYGFVLEGVFKYFFNGEHAYCLSKFYTQDRRISMNFDKETEILERVSKIEPDSSPPALTSEFELRDAKEEDISEIASLYNKVFETYPIPLDQPKYIEQLMSGDYLFMVITHRDKIISCASADINLRLGNAEITDCASHPDYRGKGLMYAVIASLEDEVRERGIHCLYSIARALSPGMNTVFKKLGYTYTGRLVNNCNIFGKFEDMNLWVKKIQ